MKKTKVLAAVLIASTMLVGAGYAAWTDTLKIGNTVKTGELSVEFKQNDGYPNARSYYYVNGVCSEDKNTYIKADIKQKNAKTTTVSIGNMYPGSLALYEAKIKNEGTIPAVFDYAVVGPIKNVGKDGKETKLPQLLKVFGAVTVYDKDGNRKDLKDANGAVIPEGQRWFYCELDTLEKTLNEYFKKMNLRLEPGDYATFDMPKECRASVAKTIKGLEGYDKVENENCINFWLPTEVKNEDEVEKATVQFDITLNFKQHNVDFTNTAK